MLAFSENGAPTLLYNDRGFTPRSDIPSQTTTIADCSRYCHRAVVQKYICGSHFFVISFLLLLPLVAYRVSAGADPGFGQGGAPASEAENC